MHFTGVNFPVVRRTGPSRLLKTCWRRPIPAPGRARGERRHRAEHIPYADDKYYRPGSPGDRGDGGSDSDTDWRLPRSNACRPLSSGHLLGVLDPLPKGERVILGVLADDEIAHLGHFGFGHADLAAEFLDLRGRFIHRRNGNVISDAL